MTNFMNMLKNDDGATLVEYALVIALIAIGCIGAFNNLRNQINWQMNNAANHVAAGQ